MKVFVSGASGFVGRNLIGHLLERGHRVSAWQHRESASLETSHPNLSVQWGDLADPGSDIKLKASLQGCDRIVHLAAKTSEDPSSQSQSRSVNIDGTDKLVRFAKGAGVSRFIFISSQSAKITHPGNYGASKKKGEEVVLASGLDAVVLRPAIIYGPGEAGIFKKFVTLVENIPVIPIPHSAITFRPVYVGDVVRCVTAAIEGPKYSARIYDVAGADPISFPQLIRKVAQTKKLFRLLIPIPMPLAILGAKALALVMKKPPVTVDNLIGLTETTAVDLKPMMEYLKVVPVSLEEGLRRSLGA